MKILYVSGMHSKLERDQLDIFHSLGHKVFSTGHYKNYQEPSSECLYGPINQDTDLETLEEFNRLNPNYKIHGIINLSKSIVDKFDLVLVENCCPLPQQLSLLWETIKYKPIIYRTYAQQQPEVEAALKTFSNQRKIVKVRVAHTESNIQNFSGLDYIIKGQIDHEKFSNWNGFGGPVLTFNNFFSKRAYHSNTPTYLQVVRKLYEKQFKLYGQYNEDTPFALGSVLEEKQVELYKTCGVYFALGSKPAALTYNFQEAIMTGCPVVTFGPKLGNGNPPMYEIPETFENGVEVFLGDSVEELSYYINVLLSNEKLAKQMSKSAREKAIKLWSKESVMSLWDQAIKSAF